MARVISIIGSKGKLAHSLKDRLSINDDIVSYGRDQVDFNDLTTINNIIPTLTKSDIIVVCSGALSDDVNETMMINSLGPIYLINELIKANCQAHVVVIGSHGATWTSWPGIDMSRLTYNIAKKCLCDFVVGLEQSDITDMKLTVVNLSRFQSPLSNYTGVSVDQVVDNISWIIDQPNPPLIFENGKEK